MCFFFPLYFCCLPPSDVWHFIGWCSVGASGTESPVGSLWLKHRVGREESAGMCWGAAPAMSSLSQSNREEPKPPRHQRKEEQEERRPETRVQQLASLRKSISTRSQHKHRLLWSGMAVEMRMWHTAPPGYLTKHIEKNIKTIKTRQFPEEL